MGFWYILSIVVGAALYVKFTFFNSQFTWKAALSIQLTLIGIGLIIFGIFMLTPASTRLIDIMFG